MTTSAHLPTETSTAKPWGYAVPTPEGYAAFVPLPAPRDLNLGLDVLRQLDRATYRLGMLSGLAANHPLAGIVSDIVLRREALASVRMSDMSATTVDLASVEAEIPSAERSIGALEVANYVAAYRLGTQRLATMSLSRRLLGELHERLLAGSADHEGSAGRPRNDQTWVGGSSGHEAVFVPPPVPEMTTLLDDLDRFVQDNNLPALIQAAVIHFQIEAIRPFDDGNGRLSRLAVPLVLNWRGVLPHPLLSISPFLAMRREEYEHRLMEVCAHSDWAGWIRFFLDGVMAQAEKIADLVNDVAALHGKYDTSMDRRGVPKAVPKLIDLLFATPVVSTSFVQRELGISLATARASIATLQDLRILTEMPARGRSKAYRANGIIELLDRER